MTTLYTIGHSTQPAADLLHTLQAYGVELLVDVRRFPGSRRHPQFGRDALAHLLGGAGIAYRHEPALGGRRPVREDSENGAWRNAGFRGYADYMGTPRFREALDRLLDHAAERPTAILCAEAVPWRCHRNLIADAAVARGTEVVHLLVDRRSEPHQVNEAARLRADGSVFYPPPDGTQPELPEPG